ncbi:RNA polymerase sigma factor [Flavilitoribacter nigricans]|uniref:RNA polymerase n=1 Tax=Flavilitoribacter nigricans (strain ATCC 23147 / DSM 23189 / NBRC 102662 / NCIMB 1420 / SS-2) TaxID=1122177 RepID=A0A2D0NAM7_FLAN2|nr:sigma-70 family RNA polymerase sigma factor [Flavilitoribacter nigricans]PHN04833.1 RNA polymerase [Flavilitoribacter nigricans DSM 23189 = NBRC 102662]
MSAEFYQEYIENNRAIIARICRAYTDNEVDFQDYFQEVCLQLWKSKDNFRQQAKLSTWIYRVSLNVCLSLVRKKRQDPKELGPAVENLSVPPRPVEDPQQRQLELLYRQIRQLKEVDRALILLYLEEKSYEEMSQILGISVSNVGVKINRIKEKLKKQLHGKV